jgi:hypothetical protein
MAAVGLRVLALAFGPSVNELTFVGLTGMSDPPKSGVAQAIGELYASGIRVVMYFAIFLNLLYKKDTKKDHRRFSGYSVEYRKKTGNCFFEHCGYWCHVGIVCANAGSQRF